MAKSRGGLVMILVFLGALFALSGSIFTLQGLGIIGPSSSFMFKSATWIYDGVAILIVGLVLISIGVAIRPKTQELPEAKAPEEPS